MPQIHRTDGFAGRRPHRQAAAFCAAAAALALCSCVSVPALQTGSREPVAPASHNVGGPSLGPTAVIRTQSTESTPLPRAPRTRQSPTATAVTTVVAGEALTATDDPTAASDHSGTSPPDSGDGARTKPMTLDEAIQLAMAQHPTLLQALRNVDRAAAIRRQVTLYPNPSIGYSASEVGNDGRAGQQGGFLQQTIVTAGKLKLNGHIADWAITRAEQQLEAQQYRVRNDVRSAFYTLLGTQQRLEILARLREVAETGVRTAQALYDAQQGTLTNVLQAQLDLGQIQILQQNAEVERQANWQRLAAAIGLPDLESRPLEGELFGDLPQYDWDDLWLRLQETSPELRAAEAAVEQAAWQVHRQRRQPIPNLIAQASVAHDYASQFDIANIQLGIPLPLFNRNQGNIDLADAEYRIAQREVERVRLSLRQRLADAYQDFEQARRQVLRYQRALLPAAERNLKLAEEGYRQGEFDFLTVLTARRTFFQVHLQYITAWTTLRTAQVTLDGLLLRGALETTPPGTQLGTLGGRSQALSGQ
ncbi:MAG: TolC family protein [Planctomycetota bacterium]|nr:MAG: TolC family protein [Planctomycetota bacterium]